MTKRQEHISIVQEKWKSIGQFKHPKELDWELDFYKSIFATFQVGKSYMFVFSPPLGTIEQLTSSMKNTLGYNPADFSIKLLLNNIHPDDLPTFVDFENEIVRFKSKLPVEKLTKYKSQYTYRLKKRNGEYIHILQQSLTIQYDEDGAVLRNLIMHTDISEFKSNSEMKLSFIGLEGEPSFIDVNVPKLLTLESSILTTREKEILQLLAQNKSTIAIAEHLNISPETVKTHRKNIHVKSGTSNTLELVLKAMKNGWIENTH